MIDTEDSKDNLVLILYVYRTKRGNLLVEDKDAASFGYGSTLAAALADYEATLRGQYRSTQVIDLDPHLKAGLAWLQAIYGPQGVKEDQP